MFNLKGIITFAIIRMFYGDFFENYRERIVSEIIDMRPIISRSISVQEGPLQKNATGFRV